MNLINTTDLSILILPTNRSGGQNRHLKILICYKKKPKNHVYKFIDCYYYYLGIIIKTLYKN